MKEEGRSAGGERDDEDVITIEADITNFVRQWLESKEKAEKDDKV